MHEDARALLDDVMDLIAKAPDGKCALSRDDIVKLVRKAKCNLPEMPMPWLRAWTCSWGTGGFGRASGRPGAVHSGTGSSSSSAMGG